MPRVVAGRVQIQGFGGGEKDGGGVSVWIPQTSTRNSYHKDKRGKFGGGGGEQKFFPMKKLLLKGNFAGHPNRGVGHGHQTSAFTYFKALVFPGK